MAGTNQKNPPPLPAEMVARMPAVILVRPQLGENIGMCARAMLNCAVTELRIVAPRDGWPNPDAVAAASGAIEILDRAKIYATTAEAVADLSHVFATTARGRDIVKNVYPLNAAVTALHEKTSGGARCGLMFGPERTGLENDDIALCDGIVNIPLNPAFSSLNLAQAVLLVCHGFLSQQNPFPLSETGDATPAGKGDVENLLQYLETELENSGFFRSPAQRPTLMRNIRNFFFRAGMTEQETRTLYGIFKTLTNKRK